MSRNTVQFSDLIADRPGIEARRNLDVVICSVPVEGK